MLGAVMFGHRHFQPVIDMIIRLAEKAAKEPRALRDAGHHGARKGRCAAWSRRICARPTQSAQGRTATTRSTRSRSKGDGALLPGRRGQPENVPTAAGRRRVQGARSARSCAGMILDTSKRIDGRDLKTVRPIVAEVGVLPRTHGSRAVHPRRDPGARGRHARHRRGRAVRSTRCRAPTSRRSCCTTTSRRSRSAKPAAWARRAGARSATASSPGARSGRCCRRATSSPTPSASCRRSPNSNGSSSMATVCGTSLALMDAGVPLAPAGRRHRHGPDPGGQEVRGALRHPRRRGPSRRHGLQGRRHRQGRHRAADGHQDRRHHRGDHEGRAQPGQGRPPAHPRRDGQGHSPRRAPELGEHAPRIEIDPDPDRQDPRSDRLRRQGDPRDRGEDRRQDRHRGRRHDQGRLGQRRVDRGRDQVDQVDRVGARGRRDLRRHRREGHGFRRLRELLRRQGRPRAHLASSLRGA